MCLLQQRQDDGFSGTSVFNADDLVFTCAVTGWSEFDPAETQTCEGTSSNGLSHKIQYTVDYPQPNSDRRAREPSFDLGEMLVR